MTQKYYSYDKELVMRDPGQVAVTATGYIGTQIDWLGAVLTELVAVVNVEAIDIGDDDELLTFRVVGSNQTDRSDAEVLATFEVGAAAAKAIDTVDNAAGDQIVARFATEKNDTLFRYIDLHMTAAGTGPTLTFNAFFAKAE